MCYSILSIQHLPLEFSDIGAWRLKMKKETPHFFAAQEACGAPTRPEYQEFVLHAMVDSVTLPLLHQTFYTPQTPRVEAITNKNIHTRFLVGQVFGGLRALHRFITCSNDQLRKVWADKKRDDALVRQCCLDNYLEAEKELENMAFALDVLYICHFITISAFAEEMDSFAKEMSILVGSIRKLHTVLSACAWTDLSLDTLHRLDCALDKVFAYVIVFLQGFATDRHHARQQGSPNEDQLKTGKNGHLVKNLNCARASLHCARKEVEAGEKPRVHVMRRLSVFEGTLHKLMDLSLPANVEQHKEWLLLQQNSCVFPSTKPSGV